MSTLDQLLETYRASALSEREKGTAFEKLVATWLVTDPVRANHFERVESFSDWAKSHQEYQGDDGIDLVATRHDGKYVAIQCKFYAPDHRIDKNDIDSFMSYSGKNIFTERLFVETSEMPWTENAERMIEDQSPPVWRISLRDLRESQVDWSAFEGTGEIKKPTPKTLRDDQVKALEAVRDGLAENDRGKLIMACGTGKTLIGLRAAEDLVGTAGHVLYLVPSLALMSQTVMEWCADATLPLTAFAVCSDSQVGKRKRFMNDVAEIDVTDLAFPATTNAETLAKSVATWDNSTMRVVFATYHSISVIAASQKEHGLSEFDLIICDEAHRTTGVKFSGEDESHFVKVHDNNLIRGKKRLYMTATPRIYGENAKTKARDAEAVLVSMDDTEIYGEILFHYGFASAVDANILTDYRVIVLAMDEGQISGAVQKRLADKDSELLLDDATKIVGCWKALAKSGLMEGSVQDPEPMRRALAFCNSIRNSKLFRDEFKRVISEYREESDNENLLDLLCEVQHVDGTQKARERGKRLDWLKEDTDTNVCRILSNARCLTEGVDVPALDAILFLHPRGSQIDVVQAVGRVMRQTPDRTKKMGYVILPIGVPPGVPANKALNDNKRYRVVWQVLNGLRAHDERLDAVINQGGLGQNVSNRITVIDGRVPSEDTEMKAVTAVVDDLPTRSSPAGIQIGRGGDVSSLDDNSHQKSIPYVIDEFSRAVMAKIVEKCGTRDYWEDWAKDVAKIAERHITRITSLVNDPEGDASKFFHDFLAELQDDLNESITDQDAIEMLAQHLITRPVFDALFENHEFVENNPVSVAMTEILSVVDEAQIDQESNNLEGFYASVRRRAVGITDPQARQKLIVELYDKFFRGAFPRTTKMLGIVYTPVEIVDFIIKSVNEVLQEEFGQTLGSKGVHILDPFTGTGTFITRLLQSGLIAPENLERKYREEIHANDIVLLAYYIAAINIETVFHSIAEREEYLPFEGICLTDTFELHESDDLLSDYMKDNSDRRERQKETDIRVIFGNPPYSAGQKSENENAKNVAYTQLDNRIRSTYAQLSTAGLLQNLYDSYIRAIRWGSDRLGEAGVMAYITNAGWIDGNAMDGLRKCLIKEFSSVYVFHLRGNAYTSGEQRKKEKGNVFGEGSRTPVAINVFVKNRNALEQGRILFHDIGDYLDRRDKLNIIKKLGSIRGIDENGGWRRITPDKHGDWLDQRDKNFERHLKIGDKKDKTGQFLFRNYSLGVSTNRDAWCINPSQTGLLRNIQSTIEFYNSELSRWQTAQKMEETTNALNSKIDEFVNNDTTKISWSTKLKNELQRGESIALNDGMFMPCMYRPFTKNWQFYSRRFNDRVGQIPRIFPNHRLPNRIIAVTGKGGRSGFSVLMMDTLPNLHTIDTGQYFPFWLYEEINSHNNNLFGDHDQHHGYSREDAITDFGLECFTSAYPSESITREDIFHYIYGLLHSEDYRNRFSANLAKDLPRIPFAKSVEDYRVFRDAGKRLGELHVDYETVEPYPATIDTGGKLLLDSSETTYRVTKMHHPGSGEHKDRSTVIYNAHITIRDIPEQAWNYVVNGKSALSWVMERQCEKIDKVSGIISDSNRYAIETIGDPRYPLDLFLKIITVSLETTKIVQSLPLLELD